MRNAWNKVMQNVSMSAQNGSAGGRTFYAIKRANPEYTDEEIYSQLGKTFRPKEVTIDEDYLDKLFHGQSKRCYWLGTLIELSDVFVKDHPLAPSVDRLNNDMGYVPGNVVIASRFANTGRRCVDDIFFLSHIIPRISEDMKFARKEMEHININDISGKLKWKMN
jgi:hypothetical protein